MSLIIISLLILTPACRHNVSPQPPAPQDVLAQVAKAIEAISIAANDAVKAVLQAMPEPTPERAQILDIINKIVLADGHAKNIVAALQASPLATPAQIANAVLPIFKDIRAAIDEGLLGIKNPEARKQAQMWLVVVSIAITSAQGILEVYYGSSNNPGSH